MRRNVFSVKAHCQVAAFDEIRFRYRRDCDKGGRVNHSFCVGCCAEDSYLVVRASECFEPFKRLLGIVQGRCQAVDAEVRVLDELGFAPFAGLRVIVGFDMAIDCMDSKLRVNVTNACSYIPSRTMKPILLQSKWSSATVPRLGDSVR